MFHTSRETSRMAEQLLAFQKELWSTKLVTTICYTLSGRVVAQVVSRRIRAPVSPCRISGGQSGTVTDSSPSSSAFPVNIIPPWLSTLTYHRGMNNRPVGGRSSEISSDTINMNKIMIHPLSFHIKARHHFRNLNATKILTELVICTVWEKPGL
jgi:hypothetical protein